jgi:hypothetical protein
MEGAARISSIEALKDFRTALIKFKAEATAALIETESELQRTLMWPRHDQTTYWQRQVRIRQELLGRAKSDLFRKQVAQDLEVRVSVDQKKAVEKAKRDLEHAEEKSRTVRRWIGVLDKELVLYRGECQGLSGMLEGGIPGLLKRLDGMIGSIEAYLMVSDTGGTAAERATEESVESGQGLGSIGDEPPPEGSIGHEHLRGAHPAPRRDEGPADPLGAGEAGMAGPEEPGA